MNILGIKKSKGLQSIGTKFNKSIQTLGSKLTPMYINPITPFQSPNHKNGIINDTNGLQQSREVIKGVYSNAKPHYNSMEKHRRHKRTNNFN